MSVSSQCTAGQSIVNTRSKPCIGPGFSSGLVPNSFSHILSSAGHDSNGTTEGKEKKTNSECWTVICPSHPPFYWVIGWFPKHCFPHGGFDHDLTIWFTMICDDWAFSCKLIFVWLRIGSTVIAAVCVAAAVILHEHQLWEMEDHSGSSVSKGDLCNSHNMHWCTKPLSVHRQTDRQTYTCTFAVWNINKGGAKEWPSIHTKTKLFSLHLNALCMS